MGLQSGTLWPELTSRPWWIGLDRWVLQDGNYTDFVTGQRRQFALEFGYSQAARLQLTSGETRPRCQHTGRGEWYETVGRLLRTGPDFPMDDDAFVLDFGLLAYKHQVVLDDLEPPGAGAWLTGEIILLVDHFAYMEDLAELTDAAPHLHLDNRRNPA